MDLIGKVNPALLKKKKSRSEAGKEERDGKGRRHGREKEGAWKGEGKESSFHELQSQR